MRVAALAFGVLAGLVASLILALGGLDVTANLAGEGERQAQAIRFGLIIIGNLGIFGAALVLAAPLAGAIVLVVGALAWVAAALLTGHTTDFVLITPPALLLVSAILAGIAHVRRPPPLDSDEPDIEIIAPERGERMQRPSDMMDDEEDEEIGVPVFAADAQPPPSRFDDDRRAPADDDWNPRRRAPPPPRTKPPFRPIEDEYDDEPSGFSRFALGLSSVLSFGLYAALAGAAILVFWNFRDAGPNEPAAVVAEVEVSDPAAAPASSQPAAPVLTPSPPAAGPSREISVAAVQPSTEPAAASSQPSAESAPRTVALPTLDDLATSPPATSIELLPSLEPPAASSEPPVAAEPVVAIAEPGPASVPAAGQPFPRLTPAQIAALRQTASPGVQTVATSAPSANNNNTGL